MNDYTFIYKYEYHETKLIIPLNIIYKHYKPYNNPDNSSTHYSLRTDGNYSHQDSFKIM